MYIYIYIHYLSDKPIFRSPFWSSDGLLVDQQRNADEMSRRGFRAVKGWPELAFQEAVELQSSHLAKKSADLRVVETNIFVLNN